MNLLNDGTVSEIFWSCTLAIRSKYSQVSTGWIDCDENRDDYDKSPSHWIAFDWQRRFLESFHIRRDRNRKFSLRPNLQIFLLESEIGYDLRLTCAHCVPLGPPEEFRISICGFRFRQMWSLSSSRVNRNTNIHRFSILDSENVLSRQHSDIW
jgi:hypothetical protein